MIELKKIVQIPSYSLGRQEKEHLHVKLLAELIRYHYRQCLPYKKFLDALQFDPTETHERGELPFLPVSIFKSQNLLSVNPDSIIRTLTSSGTSGQGLSQIYLDRYTAHNQKRALSRIVTDIIGNQRLPLLVIDSPTVVSDPRQLAARGAAIVGFSLFAKNITYALSESMELDWSAIDKFCSINQGERVLIFGFTFIVWNHLMGKLLKLRKSLELNHGVLVHGGGWKKVAEHAVDNNKFKESALKSLGVNRVHNYYGLVEQTGSIFLECENGYLHSSVLSDVSALDTDFVECGFMQSGVIKLTSLIPTSYPGNIILTEDLGRVIGEDSCACGRLGKYFEIHGRIPDAETRGCSDTRD